MKDAKGIAKYSGRYLVRPAIAEYRNVGYVVKFWHETTTFTSGDKRKRVY
jgi:hypothetical protein